MLQTAAVLLLFVPAFSQIRPDTDSKRSQSSPTALYEFSVTTDKEKYQTGEDIFITLTLKNNDGQYVWYKTDRYHWFKYLEFTLQTEDGKVIAPLSQIKNDGLPGIGAGMPVQVQPQEESKEKLTLTDLYNLGAGKYKLSVSKEITTEYSLESFVLTTDKIEIEIAEKLSDN